MRLIELTVLESELKKMHFKEQLLRTHEMWVSRELVNLHKDLCTSMSLTLTGAILPSGEYTYNFKHNTIVYTHPLYINEEVEYQDELASMIMLIKDFKTKIIFIKDM